MVLCLGRTGATCRANSRADPALRGVPILFFTSLISRAEAGDQEVFRGGEYFLAKPVSQKVLGAAVDRMLAGVATEGASFARRVSRSRGSGGSESGEGSVHFSGFTLEGGESGVGVFIVFFLSLSFELLSQPMARDRSKDAQRAQKRMGRAGQLGRVAARDQIPGRSAHRKWPWPSPVGRTLPP